MALLLKVPFILLHLGESASNNIRFVFQNLVCSKSESIFRNPVWNAYCVMGNRGRDTTQSVQAAVKPQNNTQFTFYVLSSYSFANKTGNYKENKPNCLKRKTTTTPTTERQVQESQHLHWLNWYPFIYISSKGTALAVWEGNLSIFLSQFSSWEVYL